MAARDILFFYEDVNFKLKNLAKIRAWLCLVSKNESFRLKSLNFIFCSDDYLLDLNKTFLEHDYFTDIITFDNSEKAATVIGDVFISIDRAKDNSSIAKVSLEEEVHRLLVHGLLHLLAYNDKSKKDKTIMSEKEDNYLSLLSKI